VNLVQYGLGILTQLVQDEYPGDHAHKKLLKMLVIISGDAKQKDITQEYVKGFILEVARTTTKLRHPEMLLQLWRIYKTTGGLGNGQPAPEPTSQ